MRSAAEAGRPLAEFILVQAYERGVGVPHNPETAMHWMTSAADHGFAFAQEEVAQHYADRESPDYDPVEAAIWRARARSTVEFALRHTDAAIIDAAVAGLLVDLGYALPASAEDGVPSRASTIAFQRDHRWPEQDGAVTRELLAALAGVLYAPARR